VRHAFVHFETDAGVPRAEWDAFCAKHDVKYAPESPGGNIWVTDRPGMGVECIYGGRTRKPGEPLEDAATEVMFTTPWGGPKMEQLAALARAFWIQFGGALYAETELRPLIVNGEQSAA
jgi:hypothetical protein